MDNQTRTDLLNYLNNNKIKYNFKIEEQTVTINLTVKE
jgi:hypothetical protein